jgi:dephospho-CoA kinase
MVKKKLVVGVTGMPGSGKSLAVRVAKQKGYDVVVMGDVIREEAEKRSLDPNPQNIGKIMLELRYTEGTNVIAQRCIPKIETAKKKKVIIDGIRSLKEVEEFREHFPGFSLIAIHSSPETRFKRLYKRRRSDDAGNRDLFNERDMRELSVGLGSAVAMAEHVIINEEPMGVVKEKIGKVLEKVERKWTK